MKNLVANKIQCEITAELSDPELSGELFNSVNSPLTGNEGRVTAVVAKARCIATENPARKNLEHSTGCCTSNTVIKILLVSGSDGDLLFHGKGTVRHFPYLTRRVQKSWHMSNGSFLTRGRRKVSLNSLNT